MSGPSPTVHRKAWALIALGFGLFLTLTGTAAILWHHVLWLTMMPHPHSLIPVLGVTLVATGMAVVAWGRAVKAGYRLITSHRQWSHRIRSRLMPFPTPPVWPSARWHFYAGDDFSGFTWGVIRPHIAVSRSFWDRLTESERLAVMWHEAHHARYRVPLEKVLLALLDALYPGWGYGQVLRRLVVTEEILADRWAIEALGDDTPLISALLKWLPSDGHALDTSVGWEDALSARIRFLEHPTLLEEPPSIVSPVLATTALEVAMLAQGIIFWCH